MLAGLAAPALTAGAAPALWAFAVMAAVFTGLLVSAASLVAKVTAAALHPLRLAGPAVRRWGGWLLVAIGGWFVLLASRTSPLLG